ncbi:FAD-binding oxidoreductase [Acerihabitans sp. TG2]|uniref:NAD(P)/FAD-dependent oxidoreductase n=1 Tax=Acerihabitans sp. TG2 TaxID=3096008 RepID=UPI002B22C01A|nr:FAD-binding oxidoreductase [Acerihabitans sp. TG2]MEA9390266.1 FAD-binding oxidoreductase [Acerihabitans sp. TG2]
MSKKNIAVIGAGILGLSVARSLVRKGANVTLFERSHIGAGTSTTTFAWINSNGKEPLSYHLLNSAAIDEHIKLQQESTSSVRWLIKSGTYEWASNDADQKRLDQRAKQLIALHYPAQKIEPKIMQTSIPEIRLDPRAGDIWHFPSECLLYPTLLLARLWTEARDYGARLEINSDVVDLNENSDGATLTLADGRRWQGDNVVMATGRWSQELMSVLGQKFAMIDANKADKIACGFLTYTQPQFVQLHANLITPGLNIRPEGGGRLLLQAPDLDSHANPSLPPPAEGFIGQEFLRRLRRRFENTDHAQIERIAIGQRSRPADGLPAIGYVTPFQHVYLMVTHSGMTLAPLLGRLCAEELMEQKRSPLLKDFSPERLLGKTADDFPALATLHYPAAQ